MVRFFLILLLASSPALAGVSQPNPPTPQEIAANTARFNRCLRYATKTYSLTIRVATDDNGMIVGEPEVVAPVDNDEFREDVRGAMSRIRACEPYKYLPAEKFAYGTKVQPFIFHPAPKLTDEMKAAIDKHFDDCVPVREKGPDITVRFEFGISGSYARPPTLDDRRDTVEYLRSAAEVMEALLKCPSLNLRGNQHNDWQVILRRFESLEGDKDAITPKPARVRRPGSRF